jgi:hypothetical protein
MRRFGRACMSVRGSTAVAATGRTGSRLGWRLGAWRSLVSRSVWGREVAGSNPAAPIVFKNPEYPRMRAKGPENADGDGGGIRGVSGMFVGIGTAQGSQRAPCDLFAVRLDPETRDRYRANSRGRTGQACPNSNARCSRSMRALGSRTSRAGCSDRPRRSVRLPRLASYCTLWPRRYGTHPWGMARHERKESTCQPTSRTRV